MSTKKIIRQILIGAALTINATALSTLGQQQVTAMAQNNTENQLPNLTTEQEVQNLKQIVQKRIDEQDQEYGKFKATVKEYGDKIKEIDSTILETLATTTKDLNETQEKSTKLKDQYIKLKQATQAMKASLEDQTNNTDRLLAINAKQAAEIAKQAAEIAQLKKDRQK